MKRTTPKTVGELMEQLFKSPNIAAKIAEGSLPDIWRRVVGPVVAEQTHQVRLVRGVLFVHITSAIMRNELMMRRDALVRAINKEAGIDIVAQLIVQ